MQVTRVPSVLNSMLVIICLSAGCKDGGSGRAGSSSGSPGGATTTGGATGASITSGGGSGGKSSSGTGGSAGSSSSSSIPMCNVDGPCWMFQLEYKCTAGGTAYQRYTSGGNCHDVCGPGPCSGTMCVPSGEPIPCPAGTRCLGEKGPDVRTACLPVNDAGVAITDSGAIDPRDADRSSTDSGTSIPDGSVKGLVDAFITDAAGACTPGAKRCAGLFVMTCSENGQWKDSQTCRYLCSAGVCSGECSPGSRRCRPAGGNTENTPQICSPQGAWEDQATCPDSTPTCISGKCMASCLQAGKDCTDPQTECCPGSECVSTDDRRMTFACKTIPVCAQLGGACTATADCCAGMDCTSGKCTARDPACMERPEDGTCGGPSGANCCPGTACSSDFGYETTQRCGIPRTTEPQESSCPRDRPYQHQECSAARFAMECAYRDWVKEPGYLYMCTCNYHGWSCEQLAYVHHLSPAD